MKLDVLNIQGSSTGRTVELPAEVFGIEPNEHAVYLAVKQYLANQRQGTHKAKERGEIKGSTKKIKKQKGTGTARAGNIKSPVFKGGGRAFGPRPRTYTVGLNKKVKDLARKSALSSKAIAGNVKVLEDFTFDNPKTKELATILNALETGGKKAVLVTGEYDRVLHLSGRNIKGSVVTKATDLNTYTVMRASTLILTESAVAQIKEKLA